MSSEFDGAHWKRYDRREQLLRYGLLLSTLIALVIAWRALGVRYDYVATAPREIEDMLVRMFPPDLGYGSSIIIPMIDTIHIAILGTILAALMALPVAYIGAENTSPNFLTLALGKFIISASRSVNVIIWALIFVVAFGPGALAGVLAVGVRSIGFIAKLLAEAIEEINPNQVEAVTATGATGMQRLIFGVLPQVKPALVGILTYRWDINVRAATILGFVGAGGIGAQLTRQINTFNWDAVLTILIAILIVVIFSEVISAYLRQKVS